MTIARISDEFVTVFISMRKIRKKRSRADQGLTSGEEVELTTIVGRVFWEELHQDKCVTAAEEN